eukprot:1160058-Pelagomonas_calceolata.AAC.10
MHLRRAAQGPPPQQAYLQQVIDLSGDGVKVLRAQTHTHVSKEAFLDLIATNESSPKITAYVSPRTWKAHALQFNLMKHM